MDPEGVTMNEEGRLYNFAEIWSGFQINTNKMWFYNLLEINPGLDPNLMVMEQRSDHSLSSNSRKRRDEDTEGGVCTSKCNGYNNASMGIQTKWQDYIHVRARRGQAMDSHSLAERARRERISERMKILQDLISSRL